ncbi:P-loop containing nucleoside triphosphate hydrolase, partial [Oopsacas minuta]
MQPFNGLVSFGIGKAGWNPIGKSFLVDLIFDTDFVKGSSQNSAFHFNSIDIQMTKNLFGERKDKTSLESTKWAYIDCHGHSNYDIIQVICRHLDIALIHINHKDYLNIKNKGQLYKDIHLLTQTVKHVYLLIRDYTESEVRIILDTSGDKYQTSIFIPNLTSKNTKIHSVTKSLKNIGYEILHLKLDPSKNIGSEFLEKVMSDLKYQYLNEIQKDKQLIQGITNYIDKVARSSNLIDFSFLNFYPIFVEYMSSYHQASYETDQKIIDQLNEKRGELEEKLKNTKMCDVVMQFNEILKRKNSTLIMWKLSQELSLLSKKIINCMNLTLDKVIEQKNDKYTLEILWRESLLSNKYGSLSEKDRENYAHTFAASFSNHVERGEAFELIDGDNLRFFNQDIDSSLYNLYERQNAELTKINKGKSIKMKQAPIVVSIFGPQSSGKSTLLNYCFGCKFLTSAGRCTRGIYGSLSRLSKPVNNSSHFLILDTEGLDAIERGNIQDTSLIHFDR